MSDHEWDTIIGEKTKWYNLRLKEVWRYRDLLFLFVRRDFISVYKQTILGPIWFFIQPILTTLTFTIIFSKIAGISTDKVPPLLFYLSGITLWSYFADCLNKTSNTFISNANVFGKVYFPRLIIPLSVLFSNLIKLSIQFLLFIIVWIYYLTQSQMIQPHWELLWIFPFLLIIIAGLSLGFGIFISSLTTKYRDFTFLVAFGIQLLMYASPVVYPLSLVTGKMKVLIMCNPVTSVIESFKYIFLGRGFFSWFELAYSFCFMIGLLLFSLVVFNKVERSFVDTV